ncbi:DMT family transporter [Acidimangrovimonas sediminis]|uniref:DMT family transporter n=1 Tax=Acidimangrovimonas sediminis TaxID=2056283 RepID=UPI000C7FB655|nr:DMT family transporter [Acidimangrovimonas sediminis]
MSPWILATLAAAAVQTVRFSLQRQLKGAGLSTGGATFSRFLFGFPLACLAAAVLIATQGKGGEIALPNARFWAFGIAGGIAQIAATFCTVALFSERSFAVGIAFTKTETVQVALFSTLVLGDRIPPLGYLAIVIGVAGVILLSRPPKRADGGKVTVFNRATLLGLIAGALFGASAIGYRGATLEVASTDPLIRAAVALACVTTFQTVAMALWLRWRDPGELTRVLGAWRSTALVGLTGVAGSFGWFTAFTLENAAYVRSLGQIELLFSFVVSTLIFRERSHPREVAGMAVLVVSIVMIVWISA